MSFKFVFFFSVFFSPCECVLVHSSAPVPAKALAASTGVRQSAATIQGLFTSAGRPSQIRLPICVWTSIHKALGRWNPISTNICYEIWRVIHFLTGAKLLCHSDEARSKLIKFLSAHVDRLFRYLCRLPNGFK